MSDRTAIEWTDATWNPVTGCTKVSPGCAYCYAERLTLRFKRGGRFIPGEASIQLHPERINQPLRWKKPRRIFVNSMSDLFHEDVPDTFIRHVFMVMALASQHTFQVLTKRPERMSAFMRATETESLQYLLGDIWRESGRPWTWPLPNVWLGVTAENQRMANQRIPLLMQVPAAVRFVSLEPLLGPISFRWAPWSPTKVRDATGSPAEDHLDGLRCLDWVIVGGESGGPERRRLVALQWVRSIRDECLEANVPFFFKQWGGPTPKSRGADLDGVLWRQFPRVEVAA